MRKRDHQTLDLRFNSASESTLGRTFRCSPKAVACRMVCATKLQALLSIRLDAPSRTEGYGPVYAAIRQQVEAENSHSLHRFEAGMVDLHSVVEPKRPGTRIVHQLVLDRRRAGVVRDGLLIKVSHLQPFGADGPHHIGQRQCSAQRPIEGSRSGRVLVNLSEVSEELLPLNEAERILDRMEVRFGEYLGHLPAWNQMWIDIVL